MFKHFSVFTISMIFVVLLDVFVFSKQGLIISIVMKIILYLGLFSIYIYIYRNHEAGKIIIQMIQKILFLKRLRRK